MRSLRFLPLVFVLGIDGFVMFAPYVVLALVAETTVRYMKSQPTSVPVRA